MKNKKKAVTNLIIGDYEEALEKYNIPQYTTPNLPDLEDKYKSSFGNLENNRLGGLKMIYIKTNMTEKPKSCRKCPYNEEWLKGYRVCKGVGGDGFYGKQTNPEWCPLVEKKENEE